MEDLASEGFLEIASQDALAAQPLAIVAAELNSQSELAAEGFTPDHDMVPGPEIPAPETLGDGDQAIVSSASRSEVAMRQRLKNSQQKVRRVARKNTDLVQQRDKLKQKIMSMSLEKATKRLGGYAQSKGSIWRCERILDHVRKGKSQCGPRTTI